MSLIEPEGVLTVCNFSDDVLFSSKHMFFYDGGGGNVDNADDVGVVNVD